CIGFHLTDVICPYRSTQTSNQDGANGGVAPPRPQNKRLQQTQAQVDEVVDIMRVNMEKVLERDAKLSQLDDRAGRYFISLHLSFSFSLSDALQAGASQFEASAGKLKNKYWWKNMKVSRDSLQPTAIFYLFNLIH
ncbi:vesicle-associated membrane protein 2, partial [Paragonimus westermani]